MALYEQIGLMLGTGAITGGVTLAGLRVHILYLREQHNRHEAESREIRVRVTQLEKDSNHTQGMAERAHNRIDTLKADLQSRGAL